MKTSSIIDQGSKQRSETLKSEDRQVNSLVLSETMNWGFCLFVLTITSKSSGNQK